MNETNKHAHYILPGTTMYERPDIPVLGLALEIRPTLYATDAVVDPPGECRDEWRVMNEIAKRMGLGGAYPVPPLRWLSKLGYDLPPMTLYDIVIRTGPFGDLFGLRRKGWSLKKLRERAPHGAPLVEHLPAQKLKKVLETPEGKMHLNPPEFVAEVERLLADDADEAFPMRAIGIRELKSHNSWMHNTERLVPDSRIPMVRLNPADGRDAGVLSGRRGDRHRVGARRDHDARGADRGRGARHRRHPARVGPRRRLAAREPRGRRQLQRDRLRPPRGRRAARRDVGPERDPDPHPRGRARERRASCLVRRHRLGGGRSGISPTVSRRHGA